MIILCELGIMSQFWRWFVKIFVKRHFFLQEDNFPSSCCLSMLERTMEWSFLFIFYLTAPQSILDQFWAIIFTHTTKTSFEFFIQLKCSRFVMECWGEVCLQHSSLNCPKTWHKNLFDLLLNCNKVWQIILSFIEAVPITRMLY